MVVDCLHLCMYAFRSAGLVSWMCAPPRKCLFVHDLIIVSELLLSIQTTFLLSMCRTFGYRYENMLSVIEQPFRAFGGGGGIRSVLAFLS